MKYTKREAKEYAREHFRGVWAATATPFTADLALVFLGFTFGVFHAVCSLGDCLMVRHRRAQVKGYRSPRCA